MFGSLDATLFPGISTTIQVHSAYPPVLLLNHVAINRVSFGQPGGFATAQAASATAVLAAVKGVFAAHSISHVTLVGHSLGAAIATIDGVYLQLALPVGTTFKHVIHGSPRVGNQQFADYIDAHVNISLAPDNNARR